MGATIMNVIQIAQAIKGALTATNIPANTMASGTFDTAHNSITLTHGGAQAFTLPAVNAGNVGFEIRVSNPTGFTATINTSSSQNVVGLGVSGTSLSILTLTNFHLIASYTGSTYYWARFA